MSWSTFLLAEACGYTGMPSDVYILHSYMCYYRLYIGYRLPPDKSSFSSLFFFFFDGVRKGQTPAGVIFFDCCAVREMSLLLPIPEKQTEIRETSQSVGNFAVRYLSPEQMS